MPAKHYPILDEPTYCPNRLLNDVAYFLKVDSMEALARKLNRDGGQLSRVRRRKEILTPSLILDILDATGWTLVYVRERAGLPAGYEWK